MQATEEPSTHVVERAVRPRPVPLDVEVDHPALYFNRELSWLDFNWRVLYQATDASVPLLERARFLAIAQSNLDEFFQKRVGGLKRQLLAHVTQLTPDGRTPKQQLALIRDAVVAMRERMCRLWLEVLQPALQEEEVVVAGYEDLTEEERARLHRWFMDQVYPVLTPLAVDPGHPFPFISNLSLSLAITLRHPNLEELQFARVKVPLSLGRWVELDRPGRVLPLEELVARHADELFPGMTIEDVHAFRVTRNADLRRDEEEAEDLLQMISEELRERRFSPVVRLEVAREMPDATVDMLQRELNLHDDDIYRIDGPLDLIHLTELAKLERPELLFEPWTPVVPPRLQAGPEGERPDVFSILREGDLLVHHPWDSFAASVQAFLEQAASDPGVVGIKMALYRTSENSPIVYALIRAAEAGKQVAVLVEVTARFDEERNIEWARMLEQAGVHVTYGLVGLKTHAKVLLVVRSEGEGIRTYAHVGTGNYHVATARLYTDLGLLTADPQIGLDLVHLFHYLTGHAPEQDYHSLVVAPRDLRRAIEDRLEREIQHVREGGEGRVVFKMNALDDVEMIQCLYEASRAGVQVDLLIRGHCRLRPGLEGWSDNVRVRSILGRFLEHDRVYLFQNGGEHEVLMGSADLRRRNLVERVEVLVPVEDGELRARLRRTLDLALDDNQLSWSLGANGRYTRRNPPEDAERRNYHRDLMQISTDETRRIQDSSPAARPSPEVSMDGSAESP